MTTQELQFKQYRKRTLTFARPLTLEDWSKRGALIQTLEGFAHFDVGDYLAKDSKGEWPIPKDTLENNYLPVSNISTDGWCYYRLIGIREAALTLEPVDIGTLHADAGYYLVRNQGDASGHVWPVDPEIFEQGYELVEE